MSKSKITTWCLVVDASVAGATGSDDAEHPTGILCRDFLMAIRGICHRIAWNEAIKLEWEKHESQFAREWRVSMMNLKKLTPVKESSTSDIRERIQEHCSDGAILAIVLKDCHLVEAALATDHRIASRDKKVRGHLANLMAAVPALRPILWVDPGIADENAVEWLEQGAPATTKRRLKRR